MSDVGSRLRTSSTSVPSSKIRPGQDNSLSAQLDVHDIGLSCGEVLLQVRVADSGCGLTSQSIQQLFQPYAQARHGVQHTGSSSGLGLYISRGIARQMGGDLRASSAGEGQGSVFTFEFAATLSNQVQDSTHLIPESMAPLRSP